MDKFNQRSFLPNKQIINLYLINVLKNCILKIIIEIMYDIISKSLSLIGLFVF